MANLKIRNLTPDGDFTFGKGVQDYLTGQNAIALDIKTFLKLWTGNCSWALQAGINWTQYLNKNQEAQLLGALQQGILGRYGVVGINQLNVYLNRVTRQLEVTYDVATVYTQSFVDSILIGATTSA